jgi:hypothetical protein
MSEREKELEIVSMLSAFKRAMAQETTEVFFTETGHFAILVETQSEEDPALTESTIVRRMTVGGSVEVPIPRS